MSNACAQFRMCPWSFTQRRTTPLCTSPPVTYIALTTQPTPCPERFVSSIRAVATRPLVGDGYTAVSSCAGVTCGSLSSSCKVHVRSEVGVQIGGKYPLTVEWNADDVRRYALDLEAAGVDFVSVAGHVLSSAPGRYPEKPARLY